MQARIRFPCSHLAHLPLAPLFDHYLTPLTRSEPSNRGASTEFIIPSTTFTIPPSTHAAVLESSATQYVFQQQHTPPKWLPALSRRTFRRSLTRGTSSCSARYDELDLRMKVGKARLIEVTCLIHGWLRCWMDGGIMESEWTND